jgi:hypothetical protein
VWIPSPFPIALGFYLFIYPFILPTLSSSFSLETNKNPKKRGEKKTKYMTGGKCDGTSNECFIAPHTPRLLLLLGGDKSRIFHDG